MIRETNSERETYELGLAMGREARPGPVRYRSEATGSLVSEKEVTNYKQSREF